MTSADDRAPHPVPLCACPACPAVCAPVCAPLHAASSTPHTCPVCACPACVCAYLSLLLLLHALHAATTLLLSKRAPPLLSGTTWSPVVATPVQQCSCNWQVCPSLASTCWTSARHAVSYPRSVDEPRRASWLRCVCDLATLHRVPLACSPSHTAQCRMATPASRPSGKSGKRGSRGGLPTGRPRTPRGCRGCRSSRRGSRRPRGG